MKVKNGIEGLGFVLMLVGASCDLNYSDIRAVAVLVIIGCGLMLYGGKDYVFSEDDEED
jgi:hypothetical protein